MAIFNATNGPDEFLGDGANDTFNFETGEAQATDLILGGGGTDTLAFVTLGSGTSIDFSVVNIIDIDNLTTPDGGVATSYDQTVTIFATQWAAFSSIDMNDGVDVLNIAVAGTMDISGDATLPLISGVDFSNLTGSTGNDTITLTCKRRDQSPRYSDPRF